MVEDLSPEFPSDICTFFICHFNREDESSVYTKTPVWELERASNPNSYHATWANSSQNPLCDIRGFEAKTNL